MSSGKQYEWFKSYMQMLQDDALDKEKAAKEQMWRNAGKATGIQIWRIQSMRVTSWTKEYYGRFYDGDSYIVLKTDTQKKQYNVHTWIGKYSTEDEFTTATIKMIQLCTYLDDKPNQHREAQEWESKLFKSYFNEITYLHGGAPSGLAEKEAEENKSRLFHFHGEKLKATVKEIPMDPNKIDDDDVYILDKNSEIIQWNGKGCNNGEKAAASRYIQKLKSERTGKCVKVDVIDQSQSGDRTDEFFQAMKVCSELTQKQKDLEHRVLKNEVENEERKDEGDTDHLYKRVSKEEGKKKMSKDNEVKENEVENEDRKDEGDTEHLYKRVSKEEGKKKMSRDNEVKENFDFSSDMTELESELENFDFSSDVIDLDPKNKTHELYRLSDYRGEMEFAKIKEGEGIEMSDFDGQDVFIYDTKDDLFVWYGEEASQEERRNAMFYAHKYLSDTDHPIIPVTCLSQGEETAEFISSLKKR